MVRMPNPAIDPAGEFTPLACAFDPPSPAAVAAVLGDIAWPKAVDYTRYAEPSDAFANYAQHAAVAVEQGLTAYFRVLRPASLEPRVGAVVEAVETLALRGGKRWRAALALLAFDGVASPEASRASGLAGAVALELLQTYLLIHDDWMDQDAIRRGGPSVHVELADRYRSGALEVPPSAGASVAPGDAAAILAGDYACALAQTALLPDPAALADVAMGTARCEGFRVLCEMQRQVVLGQALDVLAPLPAAGAWEHLQQVYAWKTGSYTVDGPLRLGAALAGAGAPQLRAWSAFAAPAGIAFQLADDLLGTFGTVAQTGKPRGGDLRAGKRTAIVAAMAEVPALSTYFSKLRHGFGLDAAEAEACLQVLQDGPVAAQVTALAQRSATRALALLEPIGVPAATQHCLRGAVLALVRRNA